MTLNDPDVQYKPVKDYLMGRKTLNYFISTLERAPQTGHKHIHIYVQFTSTARLAASKLHGAHVELCHGSPQQNVDYIRKENDPEKRGEILDEWGELRHGGNPTIKDVKAMSPEEREELPFNLLNLVNKVNEAETKTFNSKTVRKEVHIYYIWGPLGIGKTNLAFKLADIWGEHHDGWENFNMVKYENNFWAEVTEVTPQQFTMTSEMEI